MNLTSTEQTFVLWVTTLLGTALLLSLIWFFKRLIKSVDCNTEIAGEMKATIMLVQRDIEELKIDVVEGKVQIKAVEHRANIIEQKLRTFRATG